MYRKSLISLFFLLAVAFVSNASAQGQSVSGSVQLEKDGTLTPVTGAKVDLFRSDVAGKGQTITTGADGKFSFANVESGFQYLLFVSGPGISPDFYPEISAGTSNFFMVVAVGDGRTLNEADLKASIAKLPADDLKKRVENNKKIQSVLGTNKRVEDGTKFNQIAIKEGIPALNAKKYDEAIKMFDDAIDATPDFEGSTPVFLNAKAVALKGRARDGIIAAQKGDVTAKTAAKEKATADYAVALPAFDRGLEIIAKAPATSSSKAVMDTTKALIYYNYVQALAEMYETSIPVPETIDAAKILAGYLETETDLKKRQEVLLSFGDKSMRGGAVAASAMAFKKALETDPKDLDALSGAAIALGAMAFMDEPPNTAQMQEATKYGKQYLDAAPKDHKSQDAVVDIMESIKLQTASKKN